MPGSCRLFLIAIAALATTVLAAEPKEGLDLSSPKASMEQQVKFILAADVDHLRLCVVPPLRERITKGRLLLAHGEMRNTKVNDIVSRVEETTLEGQDAANIYSRKGKLVTTLVKVDDAWLATTVWF